MLPNHPPPFFGEVQLPYGEEPDTGSLVHIKKASADARYRCPCCMAPLVPKRGAKLAWHFAHKADHPCSGDARETVLHRRGKEILIAASGVQFTPYMTSPMYLLYTDGKDEHSVLSTHGERRVDVTALHQPVRTSPKRQVFFEICVTHPVDDQKLRELESLGVSTLEIDLGEFYKRNDWTDEQLIAAVISNAPRKWLVQGDDIEVVIERHRARCMKYLEFQRREGEYDELMDEVKAETEMQRQQLVTQLNLGVQALLEVATSEEAGKLRELLISKARARTASDINTLLGCSKQKQVFAALRAAGVLREGAGAEPDAEWGYWADGFYPTLHWYCNAAVIAWQTLRNSPKPKMDQAVQPKEALVQLLQW
jgi:hypothetical protein